MDFKTQTNTGTPQAQPQRPASSGPSFTAGGGSSRRALVAIAVGVIVLVVLVLGALMAAKGQGSAGESTQLEKDSYQAVFLTNGQVYFGHLSNVNSGYSTLKDVYYLQVQQSVQPADAKKTDSAQPQVSLTKLGNELHGPKDNMQISRQQVLFWENLKGDSTVVKAINDYKNKQ